MFGDPVGIRDDVEANAAPCMPILPLEPTSSCPRAGDFRPSRNHWRVSSSPGSRELDYYRPSWLTPRLINYSIGNKNRHGNRAGVSQVLPPDATPNDPRPRPGEAPRRRAHTMRRYRRAEIPTAVSGANCVCSRGAAACRLSYGFVAGWRILALVLSVLPGGVGQYCARFSGTSLGDSASSGRRFQTWVCPNSGTPT